MSSTRASTDSYDAREHPPGGTMPLLYAAPALIELLRLAALPAAVDRFLAALILVTQVAGLAAAAWRAARGLARSGALVEAALFAATIFFAVPAVVIVWLGAAGLARPIPVALACGLAAFALHRRARPPEPAVRAPLERFEVGMVALTVLMIGRMSVSMLREATRDADSVWYHLSTAAEIVRTGSIRANPILTDTAIGYPAAREALVAWMAMPLRSENLALLFPLEIAAAAVALYAIARSFDVARPAALAAVALFTACPSVARTAVEQKNDLFICLTFLLAWHFLREAARTGRRLHALMAGLAGGLLASTKFAGVVLLALLFVMTAAADLLARDGLTAVRRRLGPAGIALGVTALVGGVWYARNLVLLHNPLYPKTIALFGHTLFPGIAALDAQFEISKLGLRPGRVWQFRGQFFAGLGPAVALAAVPSIFAPLAALRGHARFRAGAWLWLGLLPALLFVIYARLPYSVHPRGTSYWYVQTRFLLPFFASLCVGLAAAAPERGPRSRAGLAVLALLAVGGAATWMSIPSLAVVVALAAAAAFVPFPRLLAALPRPRHAAVLVAVALLPAALAALGVETYRERVKSDPARGYRADPVEGWGDVCLWVRAHVAHARILYTGTILMFPLYGPGLTNTLDYQPSNPRQDEVEQLYRAALEHGVEYIVSFAPVTLRHGALGERFDYGPSPTRAMAARHPEAVEIAFVAGHADVVHLIRPRPGQEASRGP